MVCPGVYAHLLKHSCGTDLSSSMHAVSSAVTGKLPRVYPCAGPYTFQSGYGFDTRGRSLTSRAFLFVLSFKPIMCLRGVLAGLPKPKPFAHIFKNSCPWFLTCCRNAGSTFRFLRLSFVFHRGRGRRPSSCLSLFLDGERVRHINTYRYLSIIIGDHDSSRPAVADMLAEGRHVLPIIGYIGRQT